MHAVQVLGCKKRAGLQQVRVPPAHNLVIPRRTQPWSSGRISACHAEDPVSIPGGCILLLSTACNPLPRQ